MDQFYGPFLVPSIVLHTVGCTSLSVLLFTVNCCESVHRHPVFTNFLCTWVMYSAFMSFQTIALFASNSNNIVVPDAKAGVPLLDNSAVFAWFAAALEDVIWTIAQVSMFNLVIHLWFTMKAAFHHESASTEKWRTQALLVTPYLLGLLPVPELFPNADDRISYWRAMQGFDGVLIVITSLCDVALLVRFWRHRRILRQANIHGVMSINLLVKILIFCLFRLTFAVLFFSLPVFSNVIESFYPLLVFGLLGSQRDVMQVWLPCLWTRRERLEPREGPNSPGDGDHTAPAMSEMSVDQHEAKAEAYMVESSMCCM